MTRKLPHLIHLGCGAALLALLGCGGTSNGDGASWYETQAVALANLNGDALLDVVSADAVYGHGAPHPGFIATRLQGTSAGRYLDPVRTDTGPDPVAMAVADVDKDGHPDLVIANHQATGGALGNNYVTICYQSSTSGRFPAQTKLYVGARNPVDVAVADLGNGRPDVIVAAEGGTDLLVFMQTSPGTFSAPQSVPVGAEPTAVAAGDLTGTGVDLVAGTGTGLAVLPHGATLGTFQAAVPYTTGRHPVSIRIADLNRDGNPDIAAANWNTGADVSVLLQNGATGAFLAPLSFSTDDDYAASLAVGTLAGDTYPSLVVANYGAPGHSGTVAVLRPDPASAGRFLSPQRYAGYSGPLSIALGDLNGDGRLDMVVADGGTLVRYQDPNHPGEFLEPFELRN